MHQLIKKKDKQRKQGDSQSYKKKGQNILNEKIKDGKQCKKNTINKRKDKLRKCRNNYQVYEKEQIVMAQPLTQSIYLMTAIKKVKDQNLKTKTLKLGGLSVRIIWTIVEMADIILQMEVIELVLRKLYLQSYLKDIVKSYKIIMNIYQLSFHHKLLILLVRALEITIIDSHKYKFLQIFIIECIQLMIIKTLQKGLILRNWNTKFLLSSSATNLQDWEYIAKIDENLKQGDVNLAIKFLINSHLYGQVLDMQTYRNMHYRMNELKADITYQELTYKLYRQYFKPHALMIQWMEMLCKSKDAGTLNLIEKDYQSLNLEMPNIKEQDSQSIEEENQKQHKHGRNINQKNKTKKFDAQTINKTQQTKDKKDKEQSKVSLQPEDVQKILDVLLENYPNFIVHDVQILCDNYLDEDNQQQYSHHNQNHEQEHDNQDYQDEYNDQSLEAKIKQNLLDTIASISKIKIGRIQIISQQKSKDFKKDGDDDDQL